MSWERVQEAIEAAAHRAGRSPTEITLLVVSKGQSPARILSVYEKGQRLFGENRVQELLAKKPLLPLDINWHMIGHLQTNKVKAILPHITLLHSLDRESLLEEIAKRSTKPLPCLIEVKIAQEDTKQGVPPSALIPFVEKVLSVKEVSLRGLMGMATFTQNKKQIREEFRHLRKLFERIREEFPEAPIDTLSMGMSSDFEIAIEEGSTLVRIGAAVFSEGSS
ncbi:MAG: YggS family pyridoxal phosphate-dependent enzyme [Bacteroidia bacterium]|nr:YggS family pyridoxal phosphate-dependent enzyme [Bacteroidia bacterium]MDW8134677.1 YggS family pyridoxal phosphate-dependent enzyme [Bacteroidia bacterium]